MAIKPTCDVCKKELTDFGAILLSPPDKKAMVKKFHICRECYKKLVSDKFQISNVKSMSKSKL